MSILCKGGKELHCDFVIEYAKRVLTEALEKLRARSGNCNVDFSLPVILYY